MSPKNKLPMLPNEQIGYLIEKYEGFANWQILVDERLEKGEKNSESLNLKVDQLDSKFNSLSSKLESRHNALLLIQQQVLIAVQGQRIPGLERPGMVDDLKLLNSELTAIKNLYGDLKTSDTSRKGWFAGVATVLTICGTGLAAYFYEEFHNLMTFIENLPHAK